MLALNEKLAPKPMEPWCYSTEDKDVLFIVMTNYLSDFAAIPCYNSTATNSLDIN